jgi:ketose-bisphosphate aldolase
MRRARRGGYALGYFESWNLESLQGVVDAAEETRSPIILGFNGGFLCGTERQTTERIAWYAGLGKAAAESASVPCGLIFNECPSDDWIRLAVTSGFNLVMPSDSAAPYEEYVRRVADLTRFAHACGVNVEAQVGELPCGVADMSHADASLTDPEAAAQFVEDTDVDLLAVSVGNVHVMVSGEQGLDLERLAAIRERVSIPLVLHGGTGIRADALRNAISLGVSKVNYGTYLKQRYLTAVRAALNVNAANPHSLLGLGGADDVMVVGRLAVRDAVLERIGLLRCCGKA